MWSVLAYQVTTGAAASDTDMSAVTDPEFSQRNSHYIFTEDYQLLAHAWHGATATRANVQVPHWNAIGRFNVWPPNTTSTVQKSPPLVSWLAQAPPYIPINEEYTVKVSNTGAGEVTTYLMWIASRDWNRNLPAADLTIPVRFTASPTIVATAWSATVAITLEQSLRGGVYSIISAEAQETNGLAFRFVMPRQRWYHGRKLRPGWLTSNAIGDQLESRMQIEPFFFGEWGRFHTFELPQLEVFGITAGAQALEGRMWLRYIGESQSILEQWAGGVG